MREEAIVGNNRATAIVSGVLGVVLLVVALVLQNQADFSRNYLHDQLVAHGIVFTPVENLLPEQKAIPCLVKNAGKPLVNGKQAECYARYQIGIDLKLIDNGNSYFQAHYNGYLARVAAAQAEQTAPGAPATIDLEKKAIDASRRADDLLAGEATAGLLLTGYGFSVIGDRLQLGAVALFIAAGVFLLAASVMFVTSRRRTRQTPALHSAEVEPGDVRGR